jgi:hypothetical protein
VKLSSVVVVIEEDTKRVLYKWFRGKGICKLINEKRGLRLEKRTTPYHPTSKGVTEVGGNRIGVRTTVVDFLPLFQTSYLE